MKLYISQVGIVDSISNYISDIQNELYNCRYQSLYCPNSFKYASYIRNLKAKVNENLKEVNYINNSLKKSERKYENLFESSKRKFDLITEKKIPEKKSISSDLL